MRWHRGPYDIETGKPRWHGRCYAFTAMLRRRLSLLLFAIVLPFALVHGEEWIQRYTVDHPSANVTFRVAWKPDCGLRLKFVSGESHATVTVAIGRKDSQIEVSPPTAFSSAMKERFLAQPRSLPSEANPALPLILKIRPEFWALYLEDGQLIAYLPPAFPAPFGLVHPTAMLPTSEFLAVSVQKVEDFRFRDNFLVPEGEENQLAAWEVKSGNWRLHTVTITPVERRRPWRAGQRQRPLAAPRKGERAPQPERSPNFYSLLGRGTNAIIAAGYDFYDLYEVEAAVQLTPGEMGLVFLFTADKPQFHAFTALVRENSPDVLFRLWRTRDTQQEERQVLAGVVAQFTNGQWVKLRVKIFPHRIQCYVDRVIVLDVPIAPPLGGRFGLFANTDAGARFDDVSAHSNHDLNLLSIEEIKQALVLGNGHFIPTPRSSRRDEVESGMEYLEAAPFRREQWLILGAVQHGPHVFSASFEPQRGPLRVGLIIGYTEAHKPYQRFVSTRLGDDEIFRLERVESATATVLEEIRLDRSIKTSASLRRPVRLTADASTPGELRLYRDADMVLIHHDAENLHGASGLYVGPDCSVRISDLSYQFERDDLYRNQFEKNRAFVDDPFMRHWSSPEGQWLEDRNGLTWHKSDFLGRFMIRLLYAEKTALHLGIEPGETNGTVVVTARDGTLSLTAPTVESGVPPPSVSVTLLATGRPASDTDVLSEEAWRNLRWYVVNYDGYWVWLTSGGKILLKQRLDRPLRGPRVRVAGFKTEQLKYSYVERYNVKDYLFTESLYEWIISAGRWEVVNRFQCDPRWSHMNGESKDGQAGLWTKFLFAGNFCAELYAGTRMGWYDRCGDLNMTVLNRRTTPSEGYTVTCTGWDVDHSQLYTKLYREGKLLAQSDKYLVPRIREGNKRLGYNPLIAHGRDVHGAWYYLKLRRIGKRLEYYFDNELVFAVDDDQPLHEGSLGIWTFLNSMMVARVTIAAEKIRPRIFPFKVLTPQEASEWTTPSTSKPRFCDQMQKDGSPLETLRLEDWLPEAPAGDPQIVWHCEKGQETGFVVRSVQGNPEMAVVAHLPPVRYSELAGWRFLVKRTPRACFNFYFSVGRLDANKEFVHLRSFSHRISGEEFSKGEFAMVGYTDVPSASTDVDLWNSTTPWTPVEVWLPGNEAAGISPDPGLFVRVEGFGLMQPSDELQGLYGNGPSEQYAIKGFTEVRYTTPRLAINTNVAFLAELLDPKTRKPLVTGTNLDAVAHWISTSSATGLVTATLRVRTDNDESLHPLAWISLPPRPVLDCSWNLQQPGTVLIRTSPEYPDPRLRFLRVFLEGTELDFASRTRFEHVALLPRLPSLTKKEKSQLSLIISAAGQTYPFNLKWQNAPSNEPPVLLRIEGLSPFFTNFENRHLADPLEADPARMKICSLDPLQDSYLLVANRGAAQRLHTGFRVPTSLARYPIFQMRYRGSAMARVTLGIRSQFFAQLSEPFERAVPVRFSREFQLDNQWHTWLGMISDAVKTHSLAPSSLEAQRIELRSFRSVDQTGRFTELALDDLVLGPAISRKDQLGFTPRYYDSDGVTEVLVAIRLGLESYYELSTQQRSTLQWQKAQNDQLCVPDVPSTMQQGLAHLFLKAKDTLGNESTVTDIPFLWDTQPPKLSYGFESTTSPLCNGSVLSVRLTTEDGAPPDLEKMALLWNDLPVPLNSLGSSFINAPNEARLVLNWPYIFRKQLDESQNGQTAQIVVRGLRDGAGNETQELRIPVLIDYTADRTPPTVLLPKYPPNVLWTANCMDDTSGPMGFVAESGTTKAETVREPNEEPYLSVSVAQGVGYVVRRFDREKWDPLEYPYLAFRMRRIMPKPNTEARVEIAFEFASGQVLTLNLTHPPENDAQIALPNPIQWRSKVWEPLILDLSRLLPAKVTAANPNARVVRALRIIQKATPQEYALHLQSVFVFAPWRPQDRIEVVAFDTSGIGGISWEGEIVSSEKTLAPAAPAAGERGTGWLRLRVRDKAGNNSAPFHVAVVGAKPEQ